MVELPQKIRPAFKAGPMQLKSVKRLSGSSLCRAVLAQDSQRARAKRQQQQHARNNRRGLRNNSQLVLIETVSSAIWTRDRCAVCPVEEIHGDNTVRPKGVVEDRRVGRAGSSFSKGIVGGSVDTVHSAQLGEGYFILKIPNSILKLTRL